MALETYHSLEGLGRLAICDANVLMTAAFVPDSYSRAAVSVLRDMSFTPAVDEATYREATDTLNRIAKEINWPWNPELVLHTMARRHGLIHVPSASHVADVPHVKDHDQPVAKAAVHNDGWVLTNDAELFVLCQRAGVAARFSFDAYIHYRATVAKTVTLEDIVRWKGLGQQKGHVFARVWPGGWAGRTDIDEEFTVFDVENLGRLFFDCRPQEWVFAAKEHGRLAVPGTTEAARQEVLLVNYDWGGRLVLRSSGEAHPRQMMLPSGTQPPADYGRGRFGGELDGDKEFFGNLECVVAGSKCVSGDRWRWLLETDHGATNPWDDDVVKGWMARTVL
ncbi:MAG: hypothetical protein ACYS9X_19055 [Planctomycetota bacterium]|jgi:hypothetical protein